MYPVSASGCLEPLERPCSGENASPGQVDACGRRGTRPAPHGTLGGARAGSGSGPGPSWEARGARGRWARVPLRRAVRRPAVPPTGCSGLHSRELRVAGTVSALCVPALHNPRCDRGQAGLAWLPPSLRGHRVQCDCGAQKPTGLGGPGSGLGARLRPPRSAHSLPFSGCPAAIPDWARPRGRAHGRARGASVPRAVSVPLSPRGQAELPLWVRARFSLCYPFCSHLASSRVPHLLLFF